MRLVFVVEGRLFFRVLYMALGFLWLNLGEKYFFYGLLWLVFMCRFSVKRVITVIFVFKEICEDEVKCIRLLL